MISQVAALKKFQITYARNMFQYPLVTCRHQIKISWVIY